MLSLNKEEVQKHVLRQQRKQILKGWDIFISNVNFGTITISELRKHELIIWYYKILDLDMYSILHIPVEIARYVDLSI